MDLSIVVVSWNTRELLRRCLASVDLENPELATEVLVVDNGSVDGSPEMVERDFPAVRLIRNPDNRGFAAANNQAIAASAGRYVLLLNSDAVLLPNTAAILARYLDESPTVGMVGGQLLNLDGSFQASFNDFPSLRQELLLMTGLSRWFLSPTYPSYPVEKSRARRLVDWVGGACLMVRRATVDAIGGLDESYFMYSEEVDWCVRARRAGWSVAYVPEAKTYHGSGASAQRVPERRRAQIYRSKWLYFRKHRGPVTAETFGLLVRGVTLAKLAGWFVLGLSDGAKRREASKRQVASYRYLLGNF